MTEYEILEFCKPGRRIFFIGIGGISMHALAMVCADRGCTVSGYDRTATALTDKLTARGIKVHLCHDTPELDGAELAVYSSAIKSDNEERRSAECLGIPCVRRAEFLGALMTGYENRIGICGMHGKSTCTSMLSHIFISAGTDPTVISGAELGELGGAYRLGGDKFFIFEADEYTDSFLSFHPTTAVALNIELDHVDYFSGMEHIKRSFAQYLSYSKRAVVNIDNENAREVASSYSGELLTYGLDSSDAEYTAKDITYERGMPRFTLFRHGSELAKITLAVPGRHNIYNAIAASAAALAHGITIEALAGALATFTGAKRRFEYRGKLPSGVYLYDDYAHHPTEIRASIDAALKVAEDSRLWVVYQPHTYSRTAGLFDEFCGAFSALRPADRVIFAEIYAAREVNTWGITSGDLAKNVVNSKYIEGFTQIADYLREHIKPGDTVITMGAGDVFKVGDILLGLSDH
jgi:UDP-N-acetylmuramate--alanine ligase